MEIEHLINNTYQVVDNDGTCLFQGSEEACKRYQLEAFLEKITTTPELLEAKTSTSNYDTSATAMASFMNAQDEQKTSSPMHPIFEQALKPFGIK